jgi:16S rRNA (guanine(1405)-N(7))-methyltransferase
MTRAQTPAAEAQVADPVVAQIAREVLSSRRYRALAPELVARIAQVEGSRTSRPGEAVKRTKRRLHQICGAYFDEIDVQRAIRGLTVARDAGEEALRSECRRLMGLHASTRERLPVLDRFYRDIFRVTGRPGTVLDIGGGLGPLALAWMGLPATARYIAYDADRRLVGLVDCFLALLGIDRFVALRDVVASPPADSADVALLLKIVPCIEQQQPGASDALLRAIRAPCAAVSFPTRSLGGAAKGMVGHYRAVLDRLIAASGWELVDELAFPLETVYVLRRAVASDPGALKP